MNSPTNVSRDRGSSGLLVILGVFLFLVIAGAVGFVVYQKHHKNSTLTPASSAYLPSSGSGNNNSGPSTIGSDSVGSSSSSGNQTTGGGVENGTVVSASDTSITVKADSSTTTYAITSNTDISFASGEQFGNPNAGKATASDVHSGEKVAFLKDSANPTQLASILITP